jgi:hypothetical protein
VATFSQPGLYGKIPAQADFVRLRAADDVARALVLWLEEGSEAAKRAGAPCRSEPIRFVFRPAGGRASGCCRARQVGVPARAFAQVEARSRVRSPRPRGRGRVSTRRRRSREAAGSQRPSLRAPEGLLLPGAAEWSPAWRMRARAAESGRDFWAFGEAEGGRSTRCTASAPPARLSAAGSPRAPWPCSNVRCARTSTAGRGSSSPGAASDGRRRRASSGRTGPGRACSSRSDRSRRPCSVRSGGQGRATGGYGSPAPAR